MMILCPARAHVLQTTVYNIDIGRTEETARVKELRARLLNQHYLFYSAKMLSCFLCTSSLGAILLLFRHRKLIHGIYPGKSLRLKCGQTGCCLQSSSHSGFRRHLIKTNALTDSICCIRKLYSLNGIHVKFFFPVLTYFKRIKFKFTSCYTVLD